MKISIHAPTWGATLSTNMVQISIKFQSTHPRGVRPKQFDQNTIFFKFQSTHPRGVRPLPLLLSVHSSRFQSTHPRGVRLPWIFTTVLYINFNPRTHVGCDGTKFVEHCLYVISIHAPTWGATTINGITPISTRISIHAPTWGATFARGYLERQEKHFNPRTHVGCDIAGLTP